MSRYKVGAVTAEPRMEDLLASIRKAIHEDIGDMPAGATGSQSAEPAPRPGEELAAAASEIQQLREKISKARAGSRPAASPAEPGQPPSWTSYVRVAIPEGADRLGVLIVPGAKPQALTFELGDRAHPWGTTRLVNLTPETVEGWIGKRKLRIAPGAQATSEPAKERKTEEIVLAAAAKPGSQPRLLLSSRVILEPEKRSLVFLILRPDGSPDTRAIEDSRVLEPAGAPPPAGAGTRPPAPAGR